MSKRPDDEAIRDQLRRGDPVEDGGVPTSEQTARMRRRILAEQPEPRVIAWRPALAGAAVTLIVAVIAGWMFLGDRDPVSIPSTPPIAQQPAGGTGMDFAGPTVQNRVRQIRISTPGGTQIIWHLDPDFDI